MSKTETAFSKFHELLPNGDLVQRLEQTNREYQEKMQQYAVNHQTPLPFESTIVEDLRQAFFSVQGQSSEVNQENAKEKQTQRSRREVIKDKAMANQNAVYRGLRKIKMATDKDLHKDSDSE
ncbi:hypothetical protein NQ317_000545 [Molorchus minor]|uniref:Uncharacterized protein n=1 Tax=Molorchus minor TaxID=1323400 RepID=A0ABQ9JTA8_9CUCU|nr:hypothetical protein NQ317_000545 [Molorchus minor]